LSIKVKPRPSHKTRTFKVKAKATDLKVKARPRLNVTTSLMSDLISVVRSSVVSYAYEDY